jgi:hypothetical protein
MNRRTFLACLGGGSTVALAGCLDDTGATDADEPPEIPPQSCPPAETDRASSVCSHTVETETVYLDPSPSTATLDAGTPTEEITVTLHNQSATALSFNPHSWRLWHNPDSSWTALDQERSGNGHVTVPPESTHSWSFMETVDSVRTEPALDPGVYAAELGVPDPEADGDWIACFALVRLTA